MRHKGSVSQVNIERDKIALLLYRKAKHIAEWPTKTMRLCEIAATMPVKGYYISEEFATRYVCQRLYHKRVRTFTNPYKQQLYESLYEKVMQLKDTKRYSGASLPTCVIAALASDAPCIGLTPRNIYMLLPGKKRYRMKRK